MAIRNATPKRSADDVQRIADLVKQRTGITHKHPQATIGGFKMLRLLSIDTLRERWRHHPRWVYDAALGDYRKNRLRNVYWSVVRLRFQAVDGKAYSAKRVQVFDADRGHLLHISRFYDVKSVL